MPRVHRHRPLKLCPIGHCGKANCITPRVTSRDDPFILDQPAWLSWLDMLSSVTILDKLRISLLKPQFRVSMAPRERQSLLFINLQGPDLPTDRRTSQQLRSHAVSTALAKGRREAEHRGENFRSQLLCAEQEHTQSSHLFDRASPSGYLGVASVDPFETLSISARGLTSLMTMKRSLLAGEPVFNTNEAVHFQSLLSVFETGFADSALTAALGLILSFTANGGVLNQECSKFSLIAIHHLRQKLSNTDAAATPATIGTILLLLGLEVCKEKVDCGIDLSVAYINLNGSVPLERARRS